MIDHGTATEVDVRQSIDRPGFASQGVGTRDPVVLGPTRVVSVTVEMPRQESRSLIPSAFGQPNPGLAKLLVVHPLEDPRRSIALMTVVSRTYGAFRDWVVDAIGADGAASLGFPVRAGSVSVDRSGSDEFRVVVGEGAEDVVVVELKTEDHPPSRLELSSIAFGVPDDDGGARLAVVDVDVEMSSAGIDRTFTCIAGPQFTTTRWAAIESPWKVAGIVHECESVTLQPPADVPFEFRAFA